MKVRFYPKSEAIVSQVKAKLADVSARIAKLEAREKRSDTLFYPLSNEDISVIGRLRKEESELSDRLVLLASHVPPEMMAEIEL